MASTVTIGSRAASYRYRERVEQCQLLAAFGRATGFLVDTASGPATGFVATLIGTTPFIGGSADDPIPARLQIWPAAPRPPGDGAVMAR